MLLIMLTLVKTGDSGLTLDLRRDIPIPAFEELNQDIEGFAAEIERLELLVGVL